VMVGLVSESDFRRELAAFYRVHRKAGESKLDCFRRHTPVYNLRAGERPDAGSDHYKETLADELELIMRSSSTAEASRLLNTVDIPAICREHQKTLSGLHIGEYAARLTGVRELHNNLDIPFITSAADSALYHNLFSASLLHLFFNERELRANNIFGSTISIGKYAARGVGGAYRGDFYRDHLVFDWNAIADNLSNIIRLYEEENLGKTDLNEPKKASTSNDLEWVAQRDTYLKNSESRRRPRKW
jgi:hypothetical protein